jgi:hypothetical protein
MIARLTCTAALLSLLLGAASARAGDESLVRQYLQEQFGASPGSYGIDPVMDKYVARTFPGKSFFGVWFRQWPVAYLVPKGLAPANVFIVEDGNVSYLTSPQELEDFFFDELTPVADEDEAKDAGRTWLRLSQEFSQDGFFAFTDPEVVFMPQKKGGIVTGQVQVARGGQGEINVLMAFDASGQLSGVDEFRRVLAGIRPICQATKLLDADPLVRRMAERDILVMGSAVKPYLDEQRAKAEPALQQAIDRIWKRIQDEGR